MCGPLAFAVPALKNNWLLVVADKVTYNIGRVISYTLLGVAIGLIGRQLWLAGLQQGVSLLSGIFIVMAGLSRLFKVRAARSKVILSFMLPVNRAINYALQHKAGHLVIGMLNGFLPCGFVYLALAGAINMSTTLGAAQYMFWFGMGTFPLMLAATLSSGFVGPVVRRRINKIMPYLMVCLGFWFIVRGMGLNIPYLSPESQTTGIVSCH
jgi:sulfite exporter TauE/SafE